jgi:hypothetical protein
VYNILYTQHNTLYWFANAVGVHDDYLSLSQRILRLHIFTIKSRSPTPLSPSSREETVDIAELHYISEALYVIITDNKTNDENKETTK